MTIALTPHEIAEIFPPMDGGDFDALKSDIQARGLAEPIWLYQGKILDGRNRFRACEELGIAAATREYVGADPIGFVVSLNLKRRHLSVSQRAMIADSIANLGLGRPKNPPSENAQICALNSSDPPVSQSEAAEMVGVSRRNVQSAKKVREKGSPKLREAVGQGKATVSAAADIADLPKAEQEEAVEKGEVKEKAASVRKGKSKVNGVLTHDPADIAALRTNGKIPEGNLVDVTHVGREPGEDDAPTEEPDETNIDDDKWLESLPNRKTIEAACRPTFDADALLYKTLEPHRKTFAHHATRAINKTRRKAVYAYKVSLFLAIDHPRHWLRCPPMAMDAGAGCGGSGYIEFNGKSQKCPKCYGRGYWVK